jgi:Cys-rich protein (TIGR01571 family)
MIDERADDNLLVCSVHAACLTAGCLFFWLLALAGSCVIYSYGYRARLREKYGLPPKPCGDFCTDYWCICCSLAQETRELQNRGVDPALGNSTKQNSLPQAAFQLESNSQLCSEKPNLLLNPTAQDHTGIPKLKLLIHYKQKKTFSIG